MTDLHGPWCVKPGPDEEAGTYVYVHDEDCEREDAPREVAQPALATMNDAEFAAHLADIGLDAPALNERARELREKLAADQPTLRQLVDEQAEDEGLWFIARTAPEAYLQQELRRLHTAIEDAQPVHSEPLDVETSYLPIREMERLRRIESAARSLARLGNQPGMDDDEWEQAFTALEEALRG